MALDGTLKDFSPFNLFQVFSAEKRSGLLTVASRDETVTIGLEGGEVVFAESSVKRPEIRLGDFLLQSGRVTPSQLETALEIQKGTTQHLGRVLCDLSYCSQKEVSFCLALQMKRILLPVFQWEEGSYIFDTQETLDYCRDLVTPLNVETILMEAAVMMDERARVDRIVPSFDRVYQRVTGIGPVRVVLDKDEEDFPIGQEGGAGIPSTQKKVIQVSATEWTIYELVDGRRTLREIFSQTVFGEFTCRKTFAEIIQKRLIEEVTPSDALHRVSAIPSETEGTTEPFPPSQIISSLPLGRVLDAMPASFVLKIPISQGRGSVLQGSTDPAVWPHPVRSIFKAIEPLLGSARKGTFECAIGDVGVALFWNLENDEILAVITPLGNQGSLFRFRAHMAIFSRFVRGKGERSRSQE